MPADRPSDALRVVVAALTFRRPEDLAALLPTLADQAERSPEDVSVLIVDNDPDAGAAGQVEAFGRGVRYRHAAQPGIAAARNAALDAAGDADLLVFIDDDERPVADWLDLLLTTYRGSRPAAVVGPVVSEYAVEPDAWVQAGRFFDRRRMPTGTETTVAATNNLLLDLAVVRAAGLRFDERFGLTGGSDTLFTRALHAAGGRLVWCDEAVVTDVVPANRVTREWVLRRAYRSGNSDALTSLALTRGAAQRALLRARLVGRGGVRVLGGSASLALGRLGRRLDLEARGRRTVARGAGMLAGTVGTAYVEYKRG